MEILKGFGLNFGILLLACLYFLPTLIAIKRKSNKKTGVLLLNLFLGWTGIGWIVCFMWAFSGSEKTIVINNNTSTRVDHAEELNKLHKLKSDGVISEEDFNKLKSKLIN